MRRVSVGTLLGRRDPEAWAVVEEVDALVLAEELRHFSIVLEEEVRIRILLLARGGDGPLDGRTLRLGLRHDANGRRAERSGAVALRLGVQ